MIVYKYDNMYSLLKEDKKYKFDEEGKKKF